MVVDALGNKLNMVDAEALAYILADRLAEVCVERLQNTSRKKGRGTG